MGIHKIFDLTQVFSATMPVHSYDEPATIERSRNLKNNGYNDWRITSGMHVGTHIDGPGHISDSPVLMSQLPIERFVGKGYLIDARGKNITVQLLAGFPDEDNLIVLILTGWDKKFGSKEYLTGHPVLSEDFAQGLIARKVKMVGIDCFSPDIYPFPIHSLFFKNNTLIIENLTGLEQLVNVKNFEVIALPLKTETDSALARVIARVALREE